MLSNATTTLDSITKYSDYIDKAKELGMTSFAFSEHGSIFEWLHKKEYIEKQGMKYIHACEVYVTKSLDEKLRDNYHVVLVARNADGVAELNSLISDKKAFNREDGHFYYQPRITYDELKSTSDNIILTTACLGGILNSGDTDFKKDFLQFLIDNKHRAFLEVQHHNVEDQKKYNKLLCDISKRFGLNLIAGTDTHALNDIHMDGRKVLQKAKNIHFENEDGWDLTFKSYDELVECYRNQNSMSEEEYMKAIENTNVLSDMVEPYKLDRSIKYPKLYENSEEIIKDKIKHYIKEREITITQEIKDRIAKEFDVMKKCNAIDYILLEEDVKRWCRSQNIHYGYSRGSVSGSYVSYLMKITEMDSIKHNLIFERFLGEHRTASIVDVDTDYPPSDREKVKKYLYEKEGLYCADIITFNTIALKGAIKDVGRAFDMQLSEVDNISKNVDTDENRLREEYPELFKYVDLLNGVVVSIGSHPAGTIVSGFPIESIVGTCTLKTNEYPVTQLNMKEIDSLGFVKLDLLGLDNIEIINKACELAEIERLTPDNINSQDEDVWNSIHNSGLGIFQWESNSAINYYRRLFSKETIEKIRESDPDFQYIDLFSIGNGAIRPAGDSYREALANGDFRDNGHPALNEFLKSTRGYMVFQETLIMFLNQFCGYSMSEADVVRRGFAKKTGTEKFIPQIKSGFIKTMTEQYDTTVEEAEEIIVSFLRIVEDSSDYLFSINHSQSYSYIGYVCAYLRHYYPLEFLTSLLNVNKDKAEKTTKAVEYIHSFTDIKMKPTKFRYSKMEYMMDKKTNSIYKGIESIKFLNAKIAQELYELGKNEYNSFIDLLVDITENTSCNSKQIKILIALNFFSEFGENQMLMDIYDKFSDRYKKTHKEATKIKRLEEVLEFASTLKNETLPLPVQIFNELEYLGYIETKDESIPLDYAIATEIETKFKNHMVSLYRVNNGTSAKLKVKAKDMNENKFEKGDMIKLIQVNMEGRWKTTESGGWKQDHEDKEPILRRWSFVKY